MSISDRIKRIRHELDITQSQFGEALDASQKAVSRWEQGQEPKQDILEKIAKLGRVSLVWLSTGEGEFQRVSALTEEEAALLDNFRGFSEPRSKNLVRAKVHFMEQDFQAFEDFHGNLERLKRSFPKDAKAELQVIGEAQQILRHALHVRIEGRQRDQAEILRLEAESRINSERGEAEWLDFAKQRAIKSLDWHQGEIKRLVILHPDIIEEYVLPGRGEREQELWIKTFSKPRES